MSIIDLNLLQVFEVLYEERNVTKASARLFITQSGVSHRLARLRNVLDDPLFVRIPSGLEPTERAHRLAPRLRVALAEMRSLVATPKFDPAKAQQRFTISAGPYFCTLIVPTLIRLCRKFAPGVSLQIVNLSTNLAQAIDQQRVDLALSSFKKLPSQFQSEVLFHDEKAWAIRANHPLAKQPFDHAKFLDWPRLAIDLAPSAEFSREQPASNDIVRPVMLEARNGAISSRSPLRRSPAMIVHDVATALATTAETDMVTVVPRRFAKAYASSVPIRIVDFPRECAETIEFSMLWHSRLRANPGSLWLRSLVHDAVKLYFGVPGRKGSPGKRTGAVRGVRSAPREGS
jgi:DNA-binding transcriptional LysR family regulator